MVGGTDSGINYGGEGKGHGRTGKRGWSPPVLGRDRAEYSQGDLWLIGEMLGRQPGAELEPRRKV